MPIWASIISCTYKDSISIWLINNPIIRYHSRKLYIIDVSQSVEHDHPHASEFLRKDLANVTDYFSKKGVRVMSLMELFNFVTDPSFGDDNETVDRELEKASTTIDFLLL